MTNSKRFQALSNGIRLETDQLLHPATAFAHPQEIVRDPDLTLNEKRAMLAAWASDACAVEAAPSLRQAHNGQSPVPIDDIFEALAELDKEAQRSNLNWARRQLRRERIETLRQRHHTMSVPPQGKPH